MPPSFLSLHAQLLISPRISPYPTNFAFTRCISVNSAIDRGIHRSRRVTERSRLSSSRGSGRSRSGRDERHRENDGSETRRARGRIDAPPPSSSGSLRWGKGRRPMMMMMEKRPRDGFDGGYADHSPSHDYHRRRSSVFPPASSRRSQRMMPTGSSRHSNTPINGRRIPDMMAWEEDDPPIQSNKSSMKTPLSVPYTTSASEFLYGTSVVMAALRSRRRRLYKLYIYEAENRMRPARDREMERLARAAGVEVERVRGDWARLMDKMSAGRPHNGYVLEASPLPRLPVTALESVPSLAEKVFHVVLDRQSKEEQEVNGSDPVIPCSGKGARYPLVLVLDGILDPGNLGNILRSAYFFGVDAIAICARNSAPLSPVALKASAGSSEYIPLISVSDPGTFMDSTSRNGWKFYAAVAPPASINSSSTHPPTSSRTSNAKYISTDKLRYPLAKQPCVLMIGGEGEGLRWNLRKKADEEIGVEGKSDRKESVDSLNVSVAAGVLCEAFLRGDSLEGLKEERKREQERLF